jgi:hypothetical protein
VSLTHFRSDPYIYLQGLENEEKNPLNSDAIGGGKILKMEEMSKKKEDGGNINRKYKVKRFNVRKLGKYRQTYRVRSKFKCEGA